MSGLATVVSRIREDLNRGTDFDARIRRAITDAIHYHRATRFGWNTKRKSFLVSSEYTSLTANWLETDTLVLERSNTVDELIEKPYTWITSQARDPNYTAEPYYFAIQQRQLRLYPAPDQTYSVVMAYHYDLAPDDVSLSDSFSTGWLREGEQMIRLHAQSDVLINYIKGPEAIAEGKDCFAQSQMIEKKLKRRANREQGSGKVQPWL
jgi:hypothetical protein